MVSALGLEEGIEIAVAVAVAVAVNLKQSATLLIH
jgi:hypothetical protein